MSVRPRLILVTSLLVGVVGMLLSAAHPAGAASTVGPKAYYLALGDSLAYGFQPQLNQNAGYADDFAQYLEGRFGLAKANYINMGCPLETSTSFIHGNAPFKQCPALLVLPQKYAYTGPQMAAADTFIQQHAGQVSPVTLDIGANDLLAVLPSGITQSSCAISVTAGFTQTFITAITSFSATFTAILSNLKSVLHGQGDLLVMNYYNPFLQVCAAQPLVTRFYNLFNATLEHDVQAAGATLFDGTGPNANDCYYTWMCSLIPISVSLAVHADNQGYALIARSLAKTPGYQ